jgi:hypothetical protein
MQMFFKLHLKPTNTNSNEENYFTKHYRQSCPHSIFLQKERYRQQHQTTREGI